MQNTNTVANTSCLFAVAREPINLNRMNLKTFIQGLKGRIVSIDFTKLDGTKRTLVGRLGVKSHSKGGANMVEQMDRPYLTMFDMQAKGYRTVSLDTVSDLRCKGYTYKVI